MLKAAPHFKKILQLKQKMTEKYPDNMGGRGGRGGGGGGRGGSRAGGGRG